METKMYRADFDVTKNDKVISMRDNYYWSETDDDVIKQAQETAKRGVDFVDIGHCEMELVQIVEVDENTEFFDEIRIVYH